MGRGRNRRTVPNGTRLVADLEIRKLFKGGKRGCLNGFRDLIATAVVSSWGLVVFRFRTGCWPHQKVMVTVLFGLNLALRMMVA